MRSCTRNESFRAAHEVKMHNAAITIVEKTGSRKCFMAVSRKWNMKLLLDDDSESESKIVFVPLITDIFDKT